MIRAGPHGHSGGLSDGLVRDPLPAGRGRDGRGLSRARLQARARGGPQSAARGGLHGSGSPRPIRAGGARRLSAQPSEHRHDPRPGIVGRRPLRGDGAGRGPNAARAARSRSVAHEDAPGHRGPGGRRPRQGPRRRRRPSRPQAGEPDRLGRRLREDPGLRTRQAGGWPGRRLRAVDAWRGTRRNRGRSWARSGTCRRSRRRHERRTIARTSSALGTILYEMVAGCARSDRDTDCGDVDGHHPRGPRAAGRPPSAKTPASLQRGSSGAVWPRRRRSDTSRHSTLARELRAAREQLVGDIGLGTTADGGPSRVVARCPRRRAAAILLAGVAGPPGSWTSGAGRAGPARKPSPRSLEWRRGSTSTRYGWRARPPGRSRRTRSLAEAVAGHHRSRDDRDRRRTARTCT